MESVPDEVESTVCKTQIHYTKQNAENDLVLEFDACSRRKQEKQRQQQDNDNSAVDICHAVSDIGICRNHEPSEEIEQTGLESIIRL